MDNFFEILIPLIFAAVYFFGSMFSKKSEEDGAPERENPRRGEDPDAIERQRRIQEDIRRKIMERRQAEQGGLSRPQEGRSASRQESAADRNLRERQAAAERRRQRAQPAASVPSARSSDRAFSWGQSDGVYGRQMQDQLKKIEATKRQAERLQRQASDTQKRVISGERRQSKRTYRMQGSVRDTLLNPSAARTAFVYGEVLGRPVSQRKDESIPGLLK